MMTRLHRLSATSGAFFAALFACAVAGAQTPAAMASCGTTVVPRPAGAPAAARPALTDEQRAARAAQTAATAANPDRWEPDIRKFEDADHANPLPRGGVVFVGSSSIVRWNLAGCFPELGAKAINHGFGGSLIGDSTKYAERLVTAFKPRIVVFYAGDNDIVTNETAEQIAAEFPRFVDKVHASLPQTRIIFISIKPSIQRWAAVDKGRAANAIVKKYCETHPNLTYLDVEPQMLGPDGKPRADLLVEDGLHMTNEGYRIWTAAIKPLIKLDGNTNQ
jgi:lysophospholipase L1-like esterase